MSFEQWFAVMTLFVPAVGTLGVTLMMRRDVNRAMDKLEQHETRLDNHDLTFERAGIQLVGKKA